MDYNQFIGRDNKFSRKNFSERQYGDEKIHHIQNSHRFSQPKTRINLIKINKNKLPVDFFQKRQTPHQKIVWNKLNHQDNQMTSQNTKKSQSQRLHYSPQKTSFFGFFDQQESKNQIKILGSTKYYNRKFQTRQQPKRDAFPIDSVRKLTTANKPSNEIGDLYTLSQLKSTTEIVVSSRNSNIKLSPRKQLLSKIRQPYNMIDPQKYLGQKQQYQLNSIKKPVLNLHKINNLSEGPKQQQSLNITFFNAKSTCFPPINRQNL